MSLSDHAAELFMIGFSDPEPNPKVLALIRQSGISGVILFARNLVSPQQVRDLTDGLQACSPSLPLLIATDQEGGVVSRITGSEPIRPGNMSRGGVTVPVYPGLEGTAWPGQMTLGACDSPSLTQAIGTGVAQELTALGINMNLAPVLDVNVNAANPVIGVRSFGEDPTRVAEQGSAYIRGLHAGGVLATAKHFPGHGDTAIDSHSALAIVPHDRQRLEQVELYPFRRAIAEGVDAIMTAHLIFPAVEPQPGVPATLSRAVLTGLLREEMGFEGLIITDCLEMRSISETVGVADAAVQAIIAGADLVLISHTFSQQSLAISAVREAIATGRIPAERIESALRRIRAARERLREHATRPDLSIMGNPEHLRLAQEAAEGSVTVVGDTTSLLPMTVERTLLLAMDPDPIVEVEERQPLGSPILQAASRLAPDLRSAGVSREPGPAEIEQATTLAAETDLVLVATYAAHLFPAQARLVQQLIDSGRRVLLIAQRGPYDLLAIPEVAAAVVVYEDRTLSAEAALRFLLGQGRAPGWLPVSY